MPAGWAGGHAHERFSRWGPAPAGRNEVNRAIIRAGPPEEGGILRRQRTGVETPIRHRYGSRPPLMNPPSRFVQLRELGRMRRDIVRDRKRLRTQIQAIAGAAGFRIGSALPDPLDPDGLRILEGLAADTPAHTFLKGLSPYFGHDEADLRNALTARLDEIGRFLLTDQLRAWKSATRRIATYDALIAERLCDFQEPLDLLMTIPGVDREAACAILLELGPDIRAFESSGQCVAFAGLAPGRRSNGDHEGRGAARRRSPPLRGILIECAEAATLAEGTEFRRYYETDRDRKGHQHALVATANKLVRVIYGVLANRAAYRDSRRREMSTETDPEPRSVP